MPFSCMSGKVVIYAEDFSASEWEDLKLSVMRGMQNLTLPCCGTKASLRSGPSRQHHFAHFRGKSCRNDAWSDYSGNQSKRKKGKSESFDHQRIKDIIKEIAEKSGWCAQKEYEGYSPSGDRWIADVFAEKGEFKIAFEIQISPQQFSTYRIRQQRYRESGIKCIWLSCITPEFSDEEIPVFELSKSKGVFVIDFPEFFVPSLLKLPGEFSGVSLGEFIQLMLERGILWEQGWVSKFDLLASLEDWQRVPKPLAEKSNPYEKEHPEYSSVNASVKEKTATKNTNLGHKRTGNRVTGSVFDIRPYKFDYKLHGLKVIFFDADGTPLIDYPWFRSDIGSCKQVIAQEISKFPADTYAEVLNTITNIRIYTEPPLSQRKDKGTENTHRQPSFFD